MAERVTVNHEAVGSTQHGEILHFYFVMMMKESLIHTQPYFGEEPLIPTTFLRQSRCFPSLSFNQFTETFRSIPHLLEKICEFGMWKSQFSFLCPGFSLGGSIQLFCWLSQPKYPFIFLPRNYRPSPNWFLNIWSEPFWVSFTI